MKHRDGLADTTIPSWQLPNGVSPGTWDYTQRPSIANDYDDYFASHPLFQLDASLIEQFIPAPDEAEATIADFGCGTGRALFRLADHGFRGVAIDLSQSMLSVVRQKTLAESLPVDILRANLVDLECLRDDCVDHGISLFSTLGMIHGRENRQSSLRHIRRAIRTGGRFIVHVHNTWAVLRDPQGIRWLMNSLVRSVKHVAEFGDRVYQYRGLPNMFIHNYRMSEFRQDLQHAGFHIDRMLPIDRTAAHVLRLARVLPSLRAGGFIAICY